MHEENQQASFDAEELERRRAVVRKMNLFNNIFMKYALKYNPACEHIIRIITGIADLTVVDVKPQYELTSPTSHEALLDVFAKDSTGKLYNIEIQRADDDDHARRCRFYASKLTSDFFPKGAAYENLADVYTLYLTETDIWEQGQTVYYVEKQLSGCKKPYNDGLHQIYANAEIDDGSAIAALMQYFKNSAPDDMSQGELSKRVHLIKCEEGGEHIMNMIGNEIFDEGMIQGRIEGVIQNQKNNAINMLKNGYPDQEIFKITGITPALLQECKATL